LPSKLDASRSKQRFVDHEVLFTSSNQKSSISTTRSAITHIFAKKIIYNRPIDFLSPLDDPSDAMANFIAKQQRIIVEIVQQVLIAQSQQLRPIESQDS